MSRTFGCASAVVLFALLTPSLSNAAEGHDFLLLADNGPVLLRLHLLVDGQPAAALRDRYLDKLFAHLDRDGDGFLSKTEASHAPSLAFLDAFLQGSVAAAKGNVVPFAELDTDRDGRVSRREFDAFYRRAALNRVHLTTVPADPQADDVTDVLFRLLDRDGDGKLSRAELQRAGESLRAADFKGDELVPRESLLLLKSTGPTSKQARQHGPILVVRNEDDEPQTWTAALQQRYGDRRFDAAQLAAWRRRPPDLELRIRLDSRRQPQGAEPRAMVVRHPDRALPLADAVRALPSGEVRLTVGKMELDVQVAEAPETGVRSMHAFVRQQFQAADADGHGFLTRRQADDPLLTSLFDLADRDGDGQLTEQELSSFLDLHALGAVTFTSLTLADRSLGLFDLLDADGDGRLSLRELSTAWDRLRPYDRDGVGKLSRDELPRRAVVRLVQGKAAARPPTETKPRNSAPAPRGPEWFRKMDRNGDGYVSRREWLGSEEMFRRLDRDGDGLISPEEAEQLEVPTKK